jgi:hypothetical protein
MDLTVQLYSQDYCPSGDLSPFHAIVEESIWKQVYENEDEGGRKFVRLFNEEGTLEWIAPMGGVVYQKLYHEDEREPSQKAVYLPIWMLDSAGFSGEGETVKCSILTNDAFPEASKITLRVVDSAFYNANVKEELEAALTNLGILQNHTVLQIPVRSLGDFQVELFVSKLEPADCVLCDGEEVVVEFEEPVDHYEPPPRPPTPIPPPVAALQDGMIPNSLPPRSGFLAFQGEGRLLGGSSENAPEWRKQLGPPRQPKRS